MGDSEKAVVITPAASEKIKEHLKGQKEKGLRVYFDAGHFGLGLDEPNKEDTKISYDGFDVLVDAASLKYVQGLTVDFVKDKDGEAFSLSFPSCGTGCEGCHGSCGGE